MIRTKVPGGQLSAAQYLAHDQIASDYGNETLRLTTRQCVQFHGVLKGDLRGSIRALNDVLDHDVRRMRRHRAQRDGLPGPIRRSPVADGAGVRGSS